MVLNKLLILSVILPVILTFDSKKANKQIFNEWKNHMERDHPECRKSSGATEDEIDKYFRLHEISTTYNFKCYLNCMYRTYKFLNEDGTVNRDELVKDVDKVTNEMVVLCETKIIGEMDGCEKVYVMVNCLLHYEHVYE